MLEIQFQLGLHPTTPLGQLTALPQLHSLILGA